MSARYLIVKNKQETEFTLVSELRKFGIEANFLSSTFSDAAQNIKSFKPEIIIVDLDPNELQNNIRFLDEAEAPTIILIPTISKSDMEIILAKQPSGVLIKPYKPIDLIALLEVTRCKFADHIF